MEQNIIALNLARNCLRYIIRAFNIEEINLPFYTCPVIWQSVRLENCKIKFYHIDKNFMPVKKFKQDDYIIYTNYFGICAKNVRILEQQYKNLIVDNANAFYMNNSGIASFNSLRKFFSVTDGAFLFTKKRLNQNFPKDMTSKNRIFKKFTYENFCKNEEDLNKANILEMSEFTKNKFNEIDIINEKELRIKNFNILSKELCIRNELKINLTDEDIPMVYPFMTGITKIGNILEENGIFLTRFWSPTPQKYQEGKFQKKIIPLPITN